MLYKTRIITRRRTRERDPKTRKAVFHRKRRGNFAYSLIYKDYLWNSFSLRMIDEDVGRLVSINEEIDYSST
jgi:hypothetical protein